MGSWLSSCMASITIMELEFWILITKIVISLHPDLATQLLQFHLPTSFKPSNAEATFFSKGQGHKDF